MARGKYPDNYATLLVGLHPTSTSNRRINFVTRCLFKPRNLQRIPAHCQLINYNSRVLVWLQFFFKNDFIFINFLIFNSNKHTNFESFKLMKMKLFLKNLKPTNCNLLVDIERKFSGGYGI